MTEPQKHAGTEPGTPLDTANDQSMVSPPKMDLAYVVHHQMAARYLVGQLPPRYKFEFERFCRENPKFVDGTGLPERINAGVRLLDVAGLRQPWDPEPPKFWQRLPVVIGVAALTLLLAYTTYHYVSALQAANAQNASLIKRLSQDGSTAISGTQLVMLDPDRLTKPKQAQFTVDMTHGSKLLEIHVNMSWSTAGKFRVTMERPDEGREVVITNLLKDSNGELRLDLNSSIFGSGDHTIVIEAQGLAAADLTPVAWSRFEVVRPLR